MKLTDNQTKLNNQNIKSTMDLKIKEANKMKYENEELIDDKYPPSPLCAVEHRHAKN